MGTFAAPGGAVGQNKTDIHNTFCILGEDLWVALVMVAVIDIVKQ